MQQLPDTTEPKNAAEDAAQADAHGKAEVGVVQHFALRLAVLVHGKLEEGDSRVCRICTVDKLAEL